MCMMGLFVILWVLKPNVQENPTAGMASNQDTIEFAAAVREAFGYVPNENSNDPIDLHMLAKKLEKMKSPGEGGKTTIPRDGAEGTDPEVTTIRKGNQATVGGKLLFEPGRSELSDSTIANLDQIVSVIRGHRNIVMIKGHTSADDFPDETSPELKMDLSVKRAKAVTDYLTKAGVEPDILRMQACSTFEPVIQRTYGVGAQSSNRRVEVEVTATLVEQLRATPSSTTTSSDTSAPPAQQAPHAPGAH